MNPVYTIFQQLKYNSHLSWVKNLKPTPKAFMLCELEIQKDFVHPIFSYILVGMILIIS